MRQIVQDIGSGQLRVIEVPSPIASKGHVVISNRVSVVSSGTERAVRELAQKSLLEKARERPDQVRRVLEKAQREGLVTTYRQIRERLDEVMPLGYSASGVVVACGPEVQGFRPGDRVASNGPHASMVSVPRNLCAHIPAGVPFDQASFAVVGAIALHGLRLSKVRLGETVFVIGLGLVGQIAVTLCRAAGCRVIGTDLDLGRCQKAIDMGAEVAHPGLEAPDLRDLTDGLGADAVIVAAGTSSDEPMGVASRSVRKKGRIVLIGAVGMRLDRRPLYESEAEVVVSSSYGPGRYDPTYEVQGHDYPAAYVRWTEQRNIQAVLELMAVGTLDVSPLITHRYPLQEAETAYNLVETGEEPHLGIIFEYDESKLGTETPRVRLKAPLKESQINVGLVGAGNFARGVLIPKIKEADPSAALKLISSAQGLTAASSGDRLGFQEASTFSSEIFNDPGINCIFIATRHNLHAEQVIQAINASKNVFVEKPLAVTVEEVEQIERALLAVGDKAPLLTVGFNRRFSPAAKIARDTFSTVSQPMTISIRFNAGPLPADHWTQDQEIGGGRIIGEACHAIDLATYLADSPIKQVFAESIGGPNAPEITDDQSFITLRHVNGSVSSVAYLSGGDSAFPKERIEILGGGRMAVIDDFSRLTVAQGGKKKVTFKGNQDKGHLEEIRAFLNAIKSGGPAPIPWAELKATSLAAILAVRSLREGVPFQVKTGI